MKKVQIKNPTWAARTIYEYFKNQPGSEHIASLCAIQALLDILESQKPKVILEFGGGIGTLSYLCLKHSDAEIDIYENNDFCKEALKRNLKGFENRYVILSAKNFYLPHKCYDLVIVDDNPLHLFKDVVKHSKIKKIFFEGRRFSEQVVFRQALKENNYIFKYKRYYRFQNKEKCAYEFTCSPCNNRIIKFINHFFNELTFAREYIRIEGIKTLLLKTILY